MEFKYSIEIGRPAQEVFDFLAYKDEFPQEPGSPVLVLERLTPGPTAVGTRFREVVQMLPFVEGEILSEITRCEPGQVLDERFAGAGMSGYLSYTFEPTPGGTRLTQHEKLEARGILRPLSPLIRLALGRKIQARLVDIKDILEGSPEPAKPEGQAGQA